jgi:hypothetical protein
MLWGKRTELISVFEGIYRQPANSQPKVCQGMNWFLVREIGSFFSGTNVSMDPHVEIRLIIWLL